MKSCTRITYYSVSPRNLVVGAPKFPKNIHLAFAKIRSHRTVLSLPYSLILVNFLFGLLLSGLNFPYRACFIVHSNKLERFIDVCILDILRIVILLLHFWLVSFLLFSFQMTRLPCDTVFRTHAGCLRK
jgi:hypothetical protein